MSTILASHPAPTAERERWPVLDVLRGFALFGILVANLQHFSGATRERAVDRIAVFLIHALVDGKFYSLFALSFGYGAAAMLARHARGRSIYARRLLVLFGVGLTHLILLWYGDIIAFYAVMGAALPLFLGLRSSRLVRVAAVLLSIPVAMHVVFVILAGLGLLQHSEDWRQAAERRIASGSYGQLVYWNATVGLAQRGFDLVVTGRPFKVLAMFLLGIVAWRLHQHPAAAFQSRLERILRGALAVGVPCGIGQAIVMETAAYERLESIGTLQPVFYAVGVPALALAYASGVALWHGRGEARWLLWLAPAGRMSMTNYLLQSVLCLLVFDHFGLGGYGRLGTAGTVVVAIALFGFQVALSAVWLRRFEYGPVEWLVRCIVYGRWLRIGARIESRARGRG